MSVIFKNEKPFNVQVATPSGAGRIVPPGYYVEGDYFLSSWRSGLPLTRIKDADVDKVDRNLILATINTTGENLHAEAREVNFNANRPVAPKIEYIVEEKKDLEASLIEAMQGIGNVLPTPKDVDKMAPEQLVELAKKLGVSGSGTRKDLIKLIKEKL
jgi:hypothetical protein